MEKEKTVKDDAKVGICNGCGGEFSVNDETDFEEWTNNNGGTAHTCNSCEFSDITRNPLVCGQK